MRKASKILFLIAGIYSIVCAVTYLVFGILFVVIPNSEVWADVIKDLSAKYPDLNADAAEILKGTMIFCGVCCFIEVFLAGCNSFFGFKAWKEEKPVRALQVLNIVFGAISGVLVNVVGGIFSLVADGQEERRAALEEKK